MFDLNLLMLDRTATKVMTLMAALWWKKFIKVCGFRIFKDRRVASMDRVRIGLIFSKHIAAIICAAGGSGQQLFKVLRFRLKAKRGKGEE